MLQTGQKKLVVHWIGLLVVKAAFFSDGVGVGVWGVLWKTLRIVGNKRLDLYAI